MLSRFYVLNAAVLSGATASLLAAGAAPALAQNQPVVVQGQPENVRTERVAYRDLDLTNVKGERTLKRRVASAVRRVCLYDNAEVGLQDRGYYICSGNAWDSANPQIAQVVQRAKDIAMTGSSSLAARDITIRIANQ